MDVITYPCNNPDAGSADRCQQKGPRTLPAMALSLSRLWLAWWCRQMETFTALLAFCVGNSPVTGEFPSQKPMTRSFDVFFYLRLNQQLSKQWRRRRFETPSLSLCLHCNDLRLSCWQTLVQPMMTNCHCDAPLFKWICFGNLFQHRQDGFYQFSCEEQICPTRGWGRRCHNLTKSAQAHFVVSKLASTCEVIMLHLLQSIFFYQYHGINNPPCCISYKVIIKLSNSL